MTLYYGLRRIISYDLLGIINHFLREETSTIAQSLNQTRHSLPVLK